MKPTDYSLKKNLPGYLLVLPTFLAIILFAIYPLVQGITMGFQNYSLIQTASESFKSFIGFENYRAIFAQPDFIQAFGNTALWTVANVVIQLTLAMLISLALTQNLRARGFFRVASFIPWGVPSVIAALVFKFMYDSQIGLLNIALKHFGIISDSISWLGNVSTSLPAVTVESIWKGTPFVMIFILAALQTVPNELYESANMDGATRLQAFFHVTLPLIKDSVAIATILTTIGSINNFNAIWLMTQGGPLGSSEILFTYAYRRAFVGYEFGQAAAISTIMFLLICSLTFMYTKLIADKEE